MSRSKHFTVRLSDDDQQVLERLTEVLETDRSTAIREALRVALRSEMTLPANGTFTPFNTPQNSITIRLLPGEQNDG